MENHIKDYAANDSKIAIQMTLTIYLYNFSYHLFHTTTKTKKKMVSLPLMDNIAFEFRFYCTNNITIYHNNR